MTELATQTLEARIASVRHRIEVACTRSDRDPSSVTLVAVSKTVGREELDLAFDAGVRDFGENRVQDTATKLAAPLPPEARMHMIGVLQSNKAGKAVDLFDMVHSVDRESLIVELQRQAARRERTLDVLLQVNVAAETQKAGCDPHNAMHLAMQIAQAPNLTLLGLMTMAPIVGDPETVRPVFKGLVQLRDRLQEPSIIGNLPVLSMGMTDDFEVAIEEGATHVRIGRAIFQSPA